MGKVPPKILVPKFQFEYLIFALQPPRYRIDNWDEMMMKRDERLTGHKRGQTVRLVHHTVLACPLNTSSIAVEPRCAARFRDEQRMDDRKYLG